MSLTFSILLFLNQTGRKRVELFCYNSMTLKLLTLDIHLLGILRLILGVIPSLCLSCQNLDLKLNISKIIFQNSYGKFLSKASKSNFALQKPWVLLLKK